PPSTCRFIIALRLWARTMIAHHAAPEQPARQPSAGEIILHRRVRFLALAAALTLPADQRVAEQRAVGDDAEQLVAAQRPEADRRKGQLLRVAEIELAQRLADRQKAIV